MVNRGHGRPRLAGVTAKKRPPLQGRDILPSWVQWGLDDNAPEPGLDGQINPDALAVHRRIVDRVIEAWPALRAHFVPEAEAIDDELLRARVFACIVFVLKYQPTLDHFRDIRAARQRVRDITQRIGELANELADLVDERNELREKHDTQMTWPSFPAFLKIAREQSSRQPGLAEFMRVVGAEGHLEDYHPPQSRKSVNDIRWALVDAIASATPPDGGHGAGVKLSHAALADLLTALFDDQVDEESLRKMTRPSD